jgi:hypothetical protein
MDAAAVDTIGVGLDAAWALDVEEDDVWRHGGGVKTSLVYRLQIGDHRL